MSPEHRSSDGFRLRWWKLTRDRRIRRYYKVHRVIKISLGTGDHTRSGWLNTDYEPLNKEIVFVDVTKRFPFPEQSVDYFHTEHMIEHVPLSSAQFVMNDERSSRAAKFVLLRRIS